MYGICTYIHHEDQVNVDLDTYILNIFYTSILYPMGINIEAENDDIFGVIHSDFVPPFQGFD